MPKNEGIVPPFPLVDIQYRCGVTARAIEPSTRRWTLNDPAFGVSAFDIVKWQQVKRGSS